VTFTRQNKESISIQVRAQKKRTSWPNIYSRTHRTGSKSWVVDLGEINGKRDRQSFKTKEEANTFAEQARIKKQNEGLAAFSLPLDIKTDAFRASELLKETGQTLHQVAVEYKEAHEHLKTSGHTIEHVTKEFVQADRILRERGLTVNSVVSEYAKLFDDLKPNGATIREAVEHYQIHVLQYRNAPSIGEIVDQMLDTAESNNVVNGRFRIFEIG
jgi:hypothetical protein